MRKLSVNNSKQVTVVPGKPVNFCHVIQVNPVLFLQGSFFPHLLRSNQPSASQLPLLLPFCFVVYDCDFSRTANSFHKENQMCFGTDTLKPVYKRLCHPEFDWGNHVDVDTNSAVVHAQLSFLRTSAFLGTRTSVSSCTRSRSSCRASKSKTDHTGLDLMQACDDKMQA